MTDGLVRVLILHWGRSNAGPRLTRELARAFNELPGITAALSYSLDSDSVDQYERLNLPSFAIRTYTSGLGLIFALLRVPIIAFSLRRWLRQQRISVVVTTMFNPLQIAVLWLVRVRVIACVHDAAAHQGDRGIYNRLLGVEVQRAEGCVVFSANVADALRVRFPRKPVAQTVHGFFTQGGAGLAKNAAAGDAVVVGMFGRLGPYQGVDVFCRSVMELQRNLKIVGRVIGAGNDATQILRREYPLIEWDLRWIPEEEADLLVSRLDIVALPYREASQSGVFALAMGLGVPVVASPVGGLVEQVGDSGGGILADDASEEAFTRALRVLVEDGSRRRILAEAARSSAQRTSWSRTAADIAQAYLEWGPRPTPSS